MASHPSQPTIATYMFWIESLEKIYTKEWKVNHLNSVCDGYNLENWSCENLILANHPSQPLIMTYIFSKVEYLDELFGKTNHLSQPRFTTYIFSKIKISSGIIWRELTSQPNRLELTTHKFSKSFCK